jgi:hypothetical protein
VNPEKRGDLSPQPDTGEVLAGLVERVTYDNAENGFCVLRARARGQSMSALPPKADMVRHDRDVCFVPKAVVSRCSNRLFDHLVGEREQFIWHLETKCLGSLEIDNPTRTMTRDAQQAASARGKQLLWVTQH